MRLFVADHVQCPQHVSVPSGTAGPQTAARPFGAGLLITLTDLWPPLRAISGVVLFNTQTSRRATGAGREARATTIYKDARCLAFRELCVGLHSLFCSCSILKSVGANKQRKSKREHEHHIAAAPRREQTCGAHAGDATVKPPEHCMGDAARPVV